MPIKLFKFNIHKNGVKFSLRGFGVGYSLLLCLQVTYPGHKTLTQSIKVPYGPDSFSALTHDFLLQQSDNSSAGTAQPQPCTTAITTLTLFILQRLLLSWEGPKTLLNIKDKVNCLSCTFRFVNSVQNHDAISCIVKQSIVHMEHVKTWSTALFRVSQCKFLKQIVLYNAVKFKMPAFLLSIWKTS